MDKDKVGSILIRAKCNVESAEKEINEMVSSNSAFDDTTNTDSWSAWFDKDNGLGAAFPKREMKVYRLDAETSPKK